MREESINDIFARDIGLLFSQFLVVVSKAHVFKLV